MLSPTGWKDPIPKVLLSSRNSIDLMDAGFKSVAGARGIISMISARRSVTQLILGHNELGDDGCIVLFEFLSSELGRKHPISRISLNSNGVGDGGLLAIAQYIQGNHTLRELFLQNNRFSGNPSTSTSLAASLNTSNLEVLSLTTNPAMSDPFLEHFLPTLDSISLREIHLSAVGLTPRSAPRIVEYISSERCRLHTLKLNGNGLGFRAIRSIIRAIELNNFSLLTVEMYSNNLPAGTSDTDETSEDEHTGLEAWKENADILKRLLLRNDHLGRITRREALQLLVVSRSVLLRRPWSILQLDISRNDSPALIPLPRGVSSSPIPSVLRFSEFPMEIQLQILSLFAPNLSTAQRTRIFNYASSMSTLPPLLPRLASLSLPETNSACIADSYISSFSNKQTSNCLNGEYMGQASSVLRRRQEDRSRWLAQVGCLYFEPEKGN